MTVINLDKPWFINNNGQFPQPPNIEPFRPVKLVLLDFLDEVGYGLVSTLLVDLLRFMNNLFDRDILQD